MKTLRIVAAAVAFLSVTLAAVASSTGDAHAARTVKRTTTTVAAPTTTTPTVLPAPSLLFSDGFEALPLGTPWADGTVNGNWLSDYNGYGTNTIATDGSKVMSLSPKASTSPDLTHGGLVTTTKSFGDIDLTLRMKTVKQLRTPTPNPWETAWVIWNYEREGRFSYLALKTNGWEFGKSDNTPLDPAGPACTWPSYQNCKYPGAQRFIATASSPTYPAGSWNTVRVRQVGAQVELWANGVLLTKFVDTENVLTSGKVGLYTEDAQVHFDDVKVSLPL